MGGLVLCTKQSDIPYYIKDIDINIYSIEELAYYLYNHVYLIDEDFFSNSLIDYIENVLELKIIASGIRQAQMHKGVLAELISFVVKAASYYEPRELGKLQKELDLLGGKNGTERLKARADILLECKKYRNAFDCYKYILIKKREVQLSNVFYGKVYNNMGIVCANMFKYGDSSKYFRQGYKLSRNIVTLKHLIMADLLEKDRDVLQDDLELFKVSDYMLQECKRKILEARMLEPEEYIDFGTDEIENIIHEYRYDS